MTMNYRDSINNNNNKVTAESIFAQSSDKTTTNSEYRNKTVYNKCTKTPIFLHKQEKCRKNLF